MKNKPMTPRKVRKVSKTTLRNKIYSVCKRCGKKYYVKPSHRQRRKHCGYNCSHFKELPFTQHKYGKYLVKRYLKKKICETCGKVFYTPKIKARFCSHKCIRKAVYCPRQKHKIVKRSNGYLWVFKKDHPQANRQGYVYLHRLIVEKKIGRLIKNWEVVHHIDKDKSNNSPDNLQVMSAYEHAKIHHQDRWTKTKFFAINEAHCEKID